jgi:hypothetical protein
VLDNIFPDQNVIDPLEYIGNLDWENKLQVIETIEKGLQTLSVYIHHWGIHNDGLWTTPFAFQKDKLPDDVYHRMSNSDTKSTIPNMIG